jgi:hypothetical protein
VAVERGLVAPGEASVKPESGATCTREAQLLMTARSVAHGEADGAVPVELLSGQSRLGHGVQAARRRTSHTVTAMSSTESASRQPPSIHWNGQNRLAGW